MTQITLKMSERSSDIELPLPSLEGSRGTYVKLFTKKWMFRPACCRERNEKGGWVLSLPLFWLRPWTKKFRVQPILTISIRGPLTDDNL